jgi:C-terminal processing protease CtpA/Prc
MHYSYRVLFALVCLSSSIDLNAGEKGSIGFSAEVSVSGFFSPELTEVKVKEVFAGSPAELAGLEIGEKILAIDGCEIPGCPASKAKKLMARNIGDTLPLLVEKLDGSKHDIVIKVN